MTEAAIVVPGKFDQRTFSFALIVTYTAFLPLAIRQLTGTLIAAGPEFIAPSILAGGLALLGWFRPGMALLGLIAIAPGILGLASAWVFSFSEPLELAWSAAFIGIGTRTLVDRMQFARVPFPAWISLAVAALAVIAIASMVSVLTQTGQIDSSFWKVPRFGYDDPRFAINAAELLVGGLAMALLLRRWIPPTQLIGYLPLLMRQWLVQVALFCSLQWLTGYPQLYRGVAGNSPFQDIHALGSVALVLAVFFSAEASASRVQRPISLLMAAVSGLLCAASFSRVTWLLLAVFVGVIALAKLPRKAKLLVSVGLMLGVGAVNLLTAPEALSKYPRASRLWATFDVREIAAKEKLRQAQYIRGYEMVKAAPVFGTGIGSFRRASDSHTPSWFAKSADREFAHNAFVQIAAELGLPALLLFLSLLLALSASNSWTWPVRGGALALGAYTASQLTANSLLIYSGQPILFWLLWCTLQSSATLPLTES